MVAVVLVAALAVGLTPAAADPVDNFEDLQDLLASCGPFATATLTADIDGTDETLTVACFVDLDLNGHDLVVGNIVINQDLQLTINDTSDTVPDAGTLTTNASASIDVAGIRTTNATLIINGGTINATGGFNTAGIGGGDTDNGGTTTINGGTVNATGGAFAAGIGGGNGFGDGGTTTINGGTVNATGGENAAGIGGGNLGGFATTTITGGTVNATGGDSGGGIGGGLGGGGGETTIIGGTVTASGGVSGGGIGGGDGGAGGSVLVGVGSVVVASGGHTAVGSGEGSSVFGSLVVDGALRLPTDDLVVPDSDPDDGPEVTIGGTGQVVGTEGDPTMGAMFLGDGQVDNGGVITLAADRVLAEDVTVLDHHYEVSFDTDGGVPEPDPVTVFAPSFDAGARVFPDDPTRGTDVFQGWSTEPAGAGDPVTAAGVLPGTSADGDPVPVTAHAAWASVTLQLGLEGDAATVTAGESVTFGPTIIDELDGPVPTDPAGWTLTDADGAVTATVDTSTGEVTLASTTAGVHEVVLTVPTGAGELTAVITLTVVPAATATLDLTASATTVDQGDSTTITVTGADEFANPTGDVTDDTTFTSDVDADVVDGNTITFPSASVHTITATHAGGATATTAITVNRARATATPGDPATGAGSATPLPRTGTDVFAWVLTGLLLVAAGLAADRPHRRYTPQHLRN